MSRILDELADAFLSIRNGPKRSLPINSQRIRDQFEQQFTLKQWTELGWALRVRLPPLVTNPETWLWDEETWELPFGWVSISDMVSYLRHFLSDDAIWTDEISLYEWREAQIFAAVRAITSEQLQIPKSEIHRHSRFIEDLKAD